MDPAGKNIWFPAKRYGWGWGLPICWQGWAVMIIWLIMIIAGSALLADRSRVLYILYISLMVGILVFICYLKGEKPRWRWGGD